MAGETAYKKLIENLDDVVWTVDLNMRTTYVSPVIEKKLGFTPEERMKQTPEEQMTPDSYERIVTLFERELERENEEGCDPDRIVRIEVEYYHKNGTKLWFENLVSGLRDEKGRLYGIQGVSHDITERKRTEQALRESEEHFRMLSEASFEGILIHDKGRIITANRRFAEMFRYEPGQMIDMDALDLVSPDQRETVRQKMLSGLETPYEATGIRKDGTTFPGELRGKAITYRGRRVRITAVRDLTTQRKAEEARRESEEKYRFVVENANDAIFIAQDGMIKFANPKTTELTGYTTDQLYSIPFTDIIHPDDRNMVMEKHIKRLAGESLPSTYAFRIINKKKKLKWVELSTVLIRWEAKPATLNFLRDTTEKRKLEAQVHQAQRAESIGTLAGGIAHNFNNVLMNIQGRVSLMMMGKEASHPDMENLKKIEKSVRDATDLTKDLLGFARGGKYEVKPTDLNKLIQHENTIFSRTRKEITIHEKFEKNLWQVSADQNQMRQVLMNIYVNAWQTMPRGGNLYVHTENVTVSETEAAPFNIAPGRYARISVTDTGSGMDEETRQRIFEPFFTTREIGKGTGMGLASAYGIIKSHGGFINVYSEKEKGSTFNIYLPASASRSFEKKSAPEAPATGEGTILLVDDEHMITDVGKELLESLGYKVLTALTGEEALTVYHARKEEIDLIILDMIMPGMGGGQTFDRLKEINSHVKVLLSSGYSIEGRAQEILDRGCSGFIQKPFNIRTLSAKIRETLQAA